MRASWLFGLLFLGAAGGPANSSAQSASSATGEFSWPSINAEAKPWVYWWWMASAVDTNNLDRELNRYAEAGIGGVHIIPIYGAKGFEEKFIEYLSPQWMNMLAYTVAKANSLGLGVDMTTGSGWCFGGPRVTDAEANAVVVAETFEGTNVNQLKLDPKAIQAVIGFSTNGQYVDLGRRLSADGRLQLTAEEMGLRIYAVSQKPSGQKVKRAGPGGQGHMLNLFYPKAVENYMRWFDGAFRNYNATKPRAMYHDSYEYRSEWSPDLFAEFAARRGYKLESELPALLARRPAADDADRIARVKCDYRETLSDIMVERALPLWADWSHAHGFLTRNEAHGSPGNLLDLYALADMPETEMFYRDRNRLVSKFASSAAHVSGKKLVSCETGTWLKEHFTETLGDMKYLLDDLFLSGVNHVFYHGTCYSPDEAGWPGWHFYASYEMNPRNSIWRDVGALNGYAARCQSILQLGKPDNDILLYWPIHDMWHNPSGMVQAFTVHARGWFEDQPIGKAAEWLWNEGLDFDYISDRQLSRVKAASGGLETTGGSYRVLLVPACEHMPLSTLEKLLELARAGATVLFEGHLPRDVPGWANLAERRTKLRQHLAAIKLKNRAAIQESRFGKGKILVGELAGLLDQSMAGRRKLSSHSGVFSIRRSFEGGKHIFVANRGNERVEEWLGIPAKAKTVVLLNPLNGSVTPAAIRDGKGTHTDVYVQLEPGESIIVRAFTHAHRIDQQPAYWQSVGEPIEIRGTWQVHFVDGGPTLPSDFATTNLASWTKLGGPEAERFAGTAIYRIEFDRPDAKGAEWFLDLGTVCQSARVRLNGRDYGTLFTSPYRLLVKELKTKDNTLEIEVTNVSANRIRDLDRQGIKWKIFYDINFVNLEYKPFDASGWPLYDSGLLGPVTLTRSERFQPSAK